MISVGIRRPERQRSTRPARDGIALQQVLLVSGVISSALYVAADLLCAVRYPGYSIRDQVISELPASGAPTAQLWSKAMMIYAILVLAFSMGVIRRACDNRRLRTTGALVLLFILSGPLWSLVPMHSRGTDITWQDTGHLIMGGVTIVLLLLFMGAGAFALGRRFRVYSLASMAAVLVAGLGTFAYVPLVAAGAPTPWVGMMERLMIDAYLAWIAVLAIALLRRSPDAALRKEVAS